jgi:hypothetical protein
MAAMIVQISSQKARRTWKKIGVGGFRVEGSSEDAG